MSSPHADAHLLNRIDASLAHALACGALQPIRTQLREITHEGIRFQLRWADSLARKDRSPPPPSTSTTRPNPFLPPDPDLTVGTLAPRHVAVLNKFPVMARHLLIVTDSFQPQDAPLEPGDFEALARVMAQHDGIAFFNGGREAGASQPHRHLQWLPGDSRDPAFLPMAPRLDGRLPPPAFPHALIALPHVSWTDPTLAAAALHAAYSRALTALALPLCNPMPAHNLLLTRTWLMAVPRSRECWEGISFNALAFTGSLFVRHPDDLDRLAGAGPMTALQAVC